MMTLKGLKGGAKAAAGVVAYCQHNADSKGGYYSSGATPSAWGGSLALELGLQGLVDAKVMQGLLEGRLPDGTEFAKPSDDRRMGVDFTFSMPKSVSLYALTVASPEMRDKILAIHDRAVSHAMRLVESEFATARYGKGGAEVVKTGAMLWSTFRHEDARPVDGVVAPQIHTHTVGMNITRGRDGEFRALDMNFGNDGIKLGGADYRSQVAAGLRDLGLDLRKTEEGFELAGVSDTQIEAASPRRQQIDADLLEKGLSREDSTAAQRTASNLSTRENKITLAQDQQRWEWRELGRSVGLDLPDPTPPAEPLAPPSSAAALAHATSHLSERESVISSTSTRLHSLLHGMHEGVTLDAIDQEITAAQASGALIDAGPGRLVTRETLTREASILATISAAPPVAPLAPREAATARILAREAAQGFSFSISQMVAIRTSLYTSAQYFGIVGAAGAGKTTAIAAITDEAHAQGLHVIGLGPSQTAADGLKETGADETRTLASFTLRDRDPGAGPRLIVLDEAGMVSARDMEAFLQKVGPDDRVLFVGDPRQLAAVEAGSPFAQAMKEGVLNYSTIDEITRQKDAGLLAVAQAFADGKADEAVELADPYMQAVTVTDKDWEAAGVEKVEEVLKDGQATDAMLSLMNAIAKKQELTAPKARDFKTVREWLDQYADAALGYEAKMKTPKIPPAVRAQAIARETAAAYLALSPDEREKTLVMAGTHIIRRSINAHIRAGLQESGAVSHDSVTVTALDKSTLTRAQLREAINYEPDQILRVPEGRGAARKVVDWKILDIDPTRNTLRARDGEGREQVFKARDLDPQKSALYTPRALDLAPGDRVLFTENNRTSGFQNNETGRVLTATPEKIEIEKDNGDRVTLDPTQAATVDYGWGITVHRSQGRTIDRALVAGMSSKVATAQSAYVACSRERWHLQIVTDDKDRLKSSWSRVAERETAKDATAAASTAQAATPLEEARAHVRSEMPDPTPEPTPEREPEREPEPAPPPREKERERERELGDDFCL